MKTTYQILEQIAQHIKNTFPFEVDGDDTLILTDHPVYSKITVYGKTLELFQNTNRAYKYNYPSKIKLSDPDWLSLVSEALLIYD